MERVDAGRSSSPRKRLMSESRGAWAVTQGYTASSLLFLATLTLFPSCLVTFRDWPDANGGSTESSTTSGGNTATARLPLGGTLNSTPAGGAGTTPATTQGGTPSSSYSGGGAMSTTGQELLTAGTHSVTTSTTGSTSGGASSGGTLIGGASSGGSGGASSLGSTTGGTSHTTASTTAEAVKWLTFTGARADGTDPANASVGINGEVRVDSDECTELTFDPSTRCVRGTLCTYGFENQYWGAALVFDFVNVQGLRFRWDPRPARALGVTYRLHGTQIPKLQLWVLDMDSSLWPTSCSGTPCEIVGPPYGDESIGTAGTLYFDAMVRDNWDGTGIDYRHQPENTLSLQFKVPAVIAGSVAFDFCLDQLGIVVPTP